MAAPNGSRELEWTWDELLRELSRMRTGTIADRRCRKRKDMAARQIQVDLGPTAGIISDLSETGMSVLTLEPLNLRPGERLHVTIPDAHRPIEAGCELAWTDSSSAGMRFLVLSEKSQRSIMDWLNIESGETIWVPAPSGPVSKNYAVKNQITTPARVIAPGAPLPEAIAPKAVAVPLASAAPPQNASGAAEPLRAATPEHESALRSQTGLRLLAKLAQLLTGADGAAIALGNGVEMICRASNGRAPEAGATVWADSGLTGECLRSRDTVRCDDTHVDPRVDVEACRALRIRSVIAIPIFQREKVIGILEILSSVVRGFDEEGIELLPFLCHLIAHMASIDSVPAAPAHKTNGEMRASFNSGAIWPPANG